MSLLTSLSSEVCLYARESPFLCVISVCLWIFDARVQENWFPCRGYSELASFPSRCPSTYLDFIANRSSPDPGSWRDRGFHPPFHHAPYSHFVSSSIRLKHFPQCHSTRDALYDHIRATRSLSSALLSQDQDVVEL